MYDLLSFFTHLCMFFLYFSHTCCFVLRIKMVKKSILHANQDFVSKLQTRMTAIVDGVALQIFCLIWVCLVLIHC